MALQGNNTPNYSPMAMQKSASDPNMLFRTTLTKVSHHLTSHDADQLSFINGLPATEVPRKPLDTLRELEKRGVYSYDNIQPLITLLTNINRVDVINSCGLNDICQNVLYGNGGLNEGRERASTGGDGQERSRGVSPLPLGSRSLDLSACGTGNGTLDLSVLSQSHTTVNGTDPPFEQGGNPHDYIIKTSSPSSQDETVSPVPSATPPPMEDTPPPMEQKLQSMTLNDRRLLLVELASDPESKAYMQSLVSGQEGSALPLATGGEFSTQTVGITPELQSHDLLDQSHGMSHDLQGAVSSQPEDELLNRPMEFESLNPTSTYHTHLPSHITHNTPPPSHLTSISTQTDPQPELPTQQISTNSLLSRGDTSTSGICSDLSPSDGFATQTSTSSSLGQDDAVRSKQSAVAEGFVNVRHDESQGSLSSAVFDDKDPTIKKTTANWKLKRTDICEPIYKHSRKYFSKEVKMKSSPNLRCRDVKLTLQLTPNGLKQDEGSCMTMTVRVDVSKRSKQLCELAMLHIRITTCIEGGKDFVSAKTEVTELKKFTIHDFLPHSIVKDAHAKHVEFLVEAYLTYDQPFVPPASDESSDVISLSDDEATT